MKAAHTTLFLILALACTWIGCDRDQLPTGPSNPSKSTTKPESAAVPPTTQELLDGSRQTLTLGALPLKLDVPKSWHIDSTGGSIQALVGYSPHGPIKIYLSALATAFSDKTLPLMDKQLTKDAAASNGMIEVKPLRPLGSGPAKVREQLERQPNSIIERDGHAVPAEVMDWTIDVYIPLDKAYLQDSLHFDSLTAEQYKQDKDFLEKIIASLRYEPS